MQVRVYKNLNLSKPGITIWSIQAKIDKAWHPIAHAESVIVTNGTFYFSEAARVRCAAKHQREVHAWVEGTLAAIMHYKPVVKWCDPNLLRFLAEAGRYSPITDLPHSITYNPFVAPGFRYRASGEIVQTAARVHFTNDCTI